MYNLTYIRNTDKVLQERNGFRYIVEMTLYWNGLKFLDVVRYAEDTPDYSDDNDQDEEEGPDSSNLRFEDKVYVHSGIDGFVPKGLNACNTEEEVFEVAKRAAAELNELRLKLNKAVRRGKVAFAGHTTLL